MSSGLGQKQYTQEEQNLLNYIEQQWKPVLTRDRSTGRRPLPEQYRQTPEPPTFNLEVRGPVMAVIRHITNVNEVEAEVHDALQRACGDEKYDLFIHENVADPYHWTNEREIVERIRMRSCLVFEDGEPDLLVLAMVPKSEEQEVEKEGGKGEEEGREGGEKKGWRKWMKGLVRKKKNGKAETSSAT